MLPIHRYPSCHGQQPQLTLDPSRIVSDDQIEQIHRQSLRVLEEIGMDVVYPEAREIFRRAGASVDGERVRIGRDIVEEALKTPPAEFTFHARNPQHNIRIGGQVDCLCAGRWPAQLFRPRSRPAAGNA